MKMLSFQKIESTFKWFLLSVILFILLKPYINAGFWFDDLPNHYMGMAAHEPYFTATFNVIYAWIIGDARFLLSFVPGYAIFYYITTPILYHLFTLSLLLINVALFIKILAMLKCNKNFLIFFTLILFGLFQVSGFADPIASFGGMWPILGIFLSLGFIWLIKWQETFSLKHLIFSSFIIFTSLFFYEINLVYYPAALIVIFYNRRNTAIIKPLLFLLIPLFVYLTTVFYLRSIVENIAYDGTHFGDIKLFFITYLKQLYSALPGSYYFTLGIHDYSIKSMWDDFQTNYYGYFLFSSTILLMSLVGLSTKKMEVMPKSLYLFASIILFTVPLFMAISAKYQLILSWGVGYLPIYYQYFAVALIIAGILVKISKTPWITFCVIPIVAIFISINWMENLNLTHLLNNHFDEPFKSLEIQTKNGLFNGLSNDDTVATANPLITIAGANLVYAETKIQVNFVDIGRVEQNMPSYYVLENDSKNDKEFNYKLIKHLNS